MLSVRIQDNLDPCILSGGTKFTVGSRVVDSEWNGDEEEEAIRTIDSNSKLRSGDGIGPGA